MNRIGYLWLFLWLPLQATDYYPLDEYGDLLYKKLYQYVTNRSIVTSQSVRKYLDLDQCIKIIDDAQDKGFTRHDILKCTFSIAAKDNPQVMSILEALSEELLEHRKLKDAFLWSNFACGCTGSLAILGSWLYTAWLHRTFKVNPYINYS